MAPAIEVRGVSKRFRLYHEHYGSLKERMIHAGRIPYEDFWALSEAGLDFEVAEGSTVGLLGHNGSGKSTLLKCVAGLIQPTAGQTVTRGRVAALLELGAGFHPELTGRENIFMNGMILGLSKKHIERVFDEIVAFAELDRFIDMQVRHYSSGMYVRLGFAVAVNVDPDIMLIDEVLAVGDENFQRKCLDRIATFQREGRTILFVTHAADLVRRICDRAIVLDRGEIIADSAPGEAVRVFRDSLQRSGLASLIDEDEPVDTAGAEVPLPEEEDAPPNEAVHRVKITGVEIEHPGDAEERKWLLPDEPMTIRVRYRSVEPIDDLLFAIEIYDLEGKLIYGTNTSVAGVTVPAADGDGEMCFTFDRVPLLDGTYGVTLAIMTVDQGTVYDWSDLQHSFSVMNPTREIGLVALHVDMQFGNRGTQTGHGSAA
jgi:ABC-2 type transport system ATP-binding protein